MERSLNRYCLNIAAPLVSDKDRKAPALAAVGRELLPGIHRKCEENSKLRFFDWVKPVGGLGIGSAYSTERGSDCADRQQLDLTKPDEIRQAVRGAPAGLDRERGGTYGRGSRRVE